MKRLLAAIASWFKAQVPTDEQMALQERIRMQREWDNAEWRKEVRVASRAGTSPGTRATQNDFQGEIA